MLITKAQEIFPVTILIFGLIFAYTGSYSFQVDEIQEAIRYSLDSPKRGYAGSDSMMN